ncbi:MAG: polysulfide reductase NrfD, partial [Planctomycetes bacterium]|nr:polysulfide reductase NrfD [Planctomycetota bacterium]
STLNASQRKPEKGTLPSIFYIDGDTASLNPAATAMPDGTMWSDQARGVGHHAGVDGEKPDLLGIVRKAQATRQTADEQPVLDGLLRDLQTATGSSKVRRAYDQPDKGIQWGWEVAAYIMTKAIAAGLALLPALIFALPMLGIKTSFLNKGSSLAGITLPLLSLVFLGITGALLVKDLDQPKRFLYVMLRPQWKSWLVRGAYIVTVHGGLTTLWLVNGLILNDVQLFNLLAWPLVLKPCLCWLHGAAFWPSQGPRLLAISDLDIAYAEPRPTGRFWSVGAYGQTGGNIAWRVRVD